MKLFKKMKDGGEESTVTGYWLIEWKRFFSICLLKFEGDSREAFHTHAFDCVSWVVNGKLVENMIDGDIRVHEASVVPFVTTRTDFHKVNSVGTTWVLTFRGPWRKHWAEYLPGEDNLRVLTDGRKEVRHREIEAIKTAGIYVSKTGGAYRDPRTIMQSKKAQRDLEIVTKFKMKKSRGI